MASSWPIDLKHTLQFTGLMKHCVAVSLENLNQHEPTPFHPDLRARPATQRQVTMLSPGSCKWPVVFNMVSSTLGTT